MTIKDFLNWKGKKGTAAKAFQVYNSTTPTPNLTNGMVTWVDDNLRSYVENGYSANDIVYSIVSQTADKIRVAPWEAYTVKDESSLKLYEAELRRKDADYKKALDLRTKALESYTGDGKLNELLDWPNDRQTFQDLVADSSAAKMITGNRYIWGNLLEAGANQGKPQELFLLPSQNVDIFNNRQFPCRVTGYQVRMEARYIPFPVEMIMHDKYWNPVNDVYGQDLYGMAPLKAAAKNLTRSQSAKLASTKAYQNSGPPGVMYLDDQRMSGEEAARQTSALKKKLYEEHGGEENFHKIAASGYKVGWTAIGLSPVDLAILEAEKWDVTMLCNVFNFPWEVLFNRQNSLLAGGTGMKEAEKAITSRCALPLLTSFRDNFNRKMSTDWGWKGKNIYVDFDMSVYSELQPDLAQLTTWAMASWHLTPRMRYGLQQLEVPEKYKNDPLLDTIYVPQGLTPIEDLNAANMNNIMNQVDQQNQGQNG